MSGFKKKTPAEELIESLLKDVGDESSENSSEEGKESGEPDVDDATFNEFIGAGLRKDGEAGFKMVSENTNFDENTKSEYENTRNTNAQGKTEAINLDAADLPDIPEALGNLQAQSFQNKKSRQEARTEIYSPIDSMVTKPIINEVKGADIVKLDVPSPPQENYDDNEKTVAVAGYQKRNNDDNFDDRVKVSVGQNRGSSGYAVWGSNSSAESNLAQADNLRIAQDKIIELETENEKLRLQNEELMAASEIIKERSDLLSSQLSEYKNDRDSLEESFKNEIVLLKNHLSKKDNELQKAILKSDELESRLKFDMKKIRVRERELENRLELIRAEKNAIVKNKDEQILDLRRKMDVLQMEVESYRQKCVELNKLIETNQESFKRTTRALRLAMANLELQEENKVPMKKAE